MRQGEPASRCSHARARGSGFVHLKIPDSGFGHRRGCRGACPVRLMIRVRALAIEAAVVTDAPSADDPGFGLWPSVNPGFGLWPSGAVFRLQMDGGRTQNAQTDEKRTRDAQMDAIRTRDTRRHGGRPETRGRTQGEPEPQIRQRPEPTLLNRMRRVRVQ